MKAAGLELYQVARAVNLSERVCKRYLRHGCACYATARDLHRVIGCRIDCFDPALARKRLQSEKAAKQAKQTKIPATAR